VRVVGVLRLVDDNNVVHAHHDGQLWTDCTSVTACGITFVGYDLPHESPESSLRYTFRITSETRGIGLLRGTLEDLAVDCMSCLVRMRTWNQP
jgi:hypothetical protein